jgi:hypothetical protein
VVHPTHRAHPPPTPPPPPHRAQATYAALAARFAALSRALKWSGLAAAAAGAAELSITSIANLRAREPLVLKPGFGIPQALSPPPLRQAKWWRGEGAACRASPACQQRGPLSLAALAAQSVHRRCPHWWRGDGVECSAASSGSRSGGNLTAAALG